MVKLEVRNFGPIANIILDIRKATVFIGPQGSGKSTIAKLVAAFSWLEKSLIRGSLEESACDANHFVRQVLAYIQLDHLVTQETELSWHGDYHFHYHEGKFSIEKAEDEPKPLAKILYIPAERSFISAISDIFSTRNLPSVLYELASDYATAINSISDEEYTIPVNGFTMKYDKESRIVWIGEGKKGYEVPLPRAASGLQSLLPLTLVHDHYQNVLDYRNNSGRMPFSVDQVEKIRKAMSSYRLSHVSDSDSQYKNILLAAGFSHFPEDAEARATSNRQLGQIVDRRLSAIIEEPEQNLFPLAQKEVVAHLFAGLSRHPGNRLLMTTHSPYILTSINNLIYAEKLKAKADKVAQIVPQKCWIDGNEVSAWYFSDGSCRSIMDDALDLIRAEEIDTCSALINDEFDRLTDIEYGKDE